MEHDKVLYKQESYAIVGAAMSVHANLGCGFVEKVYQEALAIEFEKHSIPFEREKTMQISYDGQLLQSRYIVDFLCYDKIVVELKAVSSILDEHKAQVINYLKAGDMKLGLLLNFGQTGLQYERLFPPYKRT